MKEVTTSTELLVLLGLNSFDGKRGIFPSQQKLAKKCRLSRRAVNNAINGLRRKGLLTTTGYGKALTYCLLLPPKHSPETCAPPAPEVSAKVTPPAHVLLRDQKEPIEPTQQTAPTSVASRPTQRAAQAAVERLKRAYDPSHKEIDREKSIRGLAIRAGHSPTRAAVIALKVAEGITNCSPSDADRIREVIANVPLDTNAADSLAEVLRLVGMASNAG